MMKPSEVMVDLVFLEGVLRQVRRRFGPIKPINKTSQMKEFTNEDLDRVAITCDRLEDSLLKMAEMVKLFGHCIKLEDDIRCMKGG